VITAVILSAPLSGLASGVPSTMCCGLIGAGLTGCCGPLPLPLREAAEAAAELRVAAVCSSDSGSGAGSSWGVAAALDGALCTAPAVAGWVELLALRLSGGCAECGEDIDAVE
jgi:hypothetical protein